MRDDGGTVHRSRHIHAAPFDDDVVVVDGVTLTGPARTAVDLAVAAHGFAQALTVFDSALRDGVDRAELGRLLEFRRRRGIATARAALARADGRAASVGESWSRAQMIEARLPLPNLQTRFVTENGEVFTDFEWDRRLVGEFDGLLKYARDLRPGETERDVVIREKLREDRLRDLGLVVIRWIWADLEHRRAIPRIRRALDAVRR
ncbi:hypothetical protein [Gordonia sp. VNK21]|uniref:hypothetical protein n=1 Tax=Gordonia sp. VNK21 TaxID=3382483 RepID=UPI0038D35567